MLMEHTIVQGELSNEIWIFLVATPQLVVYKAKYFLFHW